MNKLFIRLLGFTLTAFVSYSSLASIEVQRESRTFKMLDLLREEGKDILLVIHPEYGSGYISRPKRDGKLYFSQNGGIQNIEVQSRTLALELNSSSFQAFKGFTSDTDVLVSGKVYRTIGMYEDGDLLVALNNTSDYQTERISHSAAITGVRALAPKNLKIDDYITFDSLERGRFRPGQISEINGLIAEVWYKTRAGEGGSGNNRDEHMTFANVPISRIRK